MRLSATESALRRALRGPCALPAGSVLLVAVSGGADSTALAVAMARIAPALGLRVALAHLHHGLRGAAADADAEQARALAARLAQPLLIGRLRPRRRTSEAALRARRRAFLRRAAARAGAEWIATAHTADDQLETLLLRLGRGTGPRGFAGMQARQGRWLKPLLLLSRAAIESDLHAAGIVWCEDVSNRDPLHARNRVRHTAIPALVAALSPGRPAAAARARLAEHTAAALAELSADGALLDRAARRRLARTGDCRALPIALWRAAPPALRRRMLRRWWRLVLGRERPGLTSRHLAMLERVAESGRGGAVVALPEGWWARLEAGRLELRHGRGPRSRRASQRRATRTTG